MGGIRTFTFIFFKWRVRDVSVAASYNMKQ